MMADFSRIRYLLKPKSIAVVGASDDAARIGGRPLRILADRGYEGDVYAVNPKYRTAQGIPCYPDIPSLPAGPELYVVALPAESAVTALEAAGRRGAKAAVVFSGGFAEIGPHGRMLQSRLRAIADEYGIALAGPNCLGMASFRTRSYATFATALETLPEIPPGDVALVAQSGGFAFNLFTESFWAGARFSHVIATGNEAGLCFADYLDYLADDAETAAVIGYLEGVFDGNRFTQALEHLRRAGKPTFLLKAGSSERGGIAVVSHTAQMSGDDAAFGAAFERHGVTRLTTIDEAVNVARALSLASPATGVGVATNSGGAAVYLSDICDRQGICLPRLSSSTKQRLAAVLPGFAGLDNPIDMTAQVINDRSLVARTIEALDADESVDLVLVFLGSMQYLSSELIETLAKCHGGLHKPLLISWCGVSETVRIAVADAGLAVCADPARALAGFGAVRAARDALGSAPGSSIGRELGTTYAELQWPDELKTRPAEGGRPVLDEWQTMQLLDQLELPTPRRGIARSSDEAVEIGAVTGYPCVLKLLDPFLPHRARVGAVRTNLESESALRAAFGDLRAKHKARLVLVAEQVPAATELLAGVLHDPTFGTRAVIGFGGIWANEVNDARTLVPPYREDYVRHALSQLRLAQRFVAAGVGLTSLSEQVAPLLRALAAVVSDSAGSVTEVECNPVLVRPEGAIIVDALAFTEVPAPGMPV